MLSLFKKYATTNVELNNYNELDAIKELARIAAKKSNQDEQLVKSGLLASVAQAPQPSTAGFSPPRPPSLKPTTSTLWPLLSLRTSTGMVPTSTSRS